MNWLERESAPARFGHFVLLTLCEFLSVVAVIAMTGLLAFGWDEFLPIMRVVWIFYVLLLILTGSYAWYDYLAGRRIRGPALNLAILFGFPVLVFVSADLFGWTGSA